MYLSSQCDAPVAVTARRYYCHFISTGFHTEDLKTFTAQHSAARVGKAIAKALCDHGLPDAVITLQNDDGDTLV